MLEFPRLLRWVAIVSLLGWFVTLPLRDILAFPERLSVLPNLQTDAAAYDAFAYDFATSRELSALPSKHPPGWMVMLAGVYAVFGHSYVAGKLLSWLALIVAVTVSAWLAHRVYGRTAAIIAALLCASSPGLRGYVGTLQYEVVTAALFIAFLALSIRTLDAATPSGAVWRAALAGVAGAVLVLTRETFVLVVIITAGWLWSQPSSTMALRPTSARPRSRTHLAIPAVMLLTASAPALAWSVAQTLHYQRLILISEKGPKEFQLGNNPLANGTYNEPLVGMGEPAGIAFIRAFPGEAIRLAARKVLYSFGVLRDGWNVPHPPIVWAWRATTGAVPLAVIEPIMGGGWLLALCLLALWAWGRRGIGAWWVLPATVSAILGVHIITLASYRFAIPLLPVLYVIVSGPLARLARASASAVRTPVVALGCAVILLVTIAAQFQAWPLHARYDAVDLEGVAAVNTVDETAGTPVRVADAERGERPVALLPDYYMPRGTMRVMTRLRRTSIAAQDTTPAARITLQALDARTPCMTDVLVSQIPNDRFVEIPLVCQLDHDGPATLAVFTLGQVDLSIEAVELTWR